MTGELFLAENLFASFDSQTLFLIILLFIWTLIWKGLALWKSARLSQKWWFVVLLLVNTFGILEILYLRVFSRKKNTNVSRF